uniref:COP9 signalosome complex subunit 9 n=1 Tax=Monodelphis domestica TaxID=13616 RepID=A0A5F8G729_MONDO
MKPAVEETFPQDPGLYVDLEGGRRPLIDLAANEKAFHAEFFNDFEELFDDDDIQGNDFQLWKPKMLNVLWQ